MKKALTLIFIVISTGVLCFALVHYVNIQSFLFAWILNFTLMGGVLFFTETLKSQYTSSYYKQKKWEQDGKIYEGLGINFYRKLLVWIGWERLNKKNNPVEKNTTALLQLYYKTKQSESGHLIILIIVLAFTVFVASKYGISNALSLLILNILLNLYPVFLQRYNRPRIERVLKLRSRTEQEPA